MATRPSPRSSDGIRPRTKSGTGTGAGRPPSSPRSSNASRPSTGRSSASSDKPMPSFLRPTVSSSLHSSTSSSSLTSSTSFKGSTATTRRSTDKAPAQQVGSPRPITPRDKTKAAPASTSRWSAVSAKQLMQKASNAIKATKSRSKTSNEAAIQAASSSGKEAARTSASASVKEAARTAASSSGKEAVRPAASVSVKDAANSASNKQPAASSSDAKGETARAQPVQEQKHQPETPAESLPAVQAEEAVVEDKAEGNEQHAATSQEVAGTDITAVEERGQTEEVSEEQPTDESANEDVVEEKHILDGAEAMNMESQSFAVAETETEAQKNTGDESPAVVVGEAMKETATPEGEDEPAISAVEETVVEETEAEGRQQEEERKPEDVVENSETSEISEQPKEETSVIIEQQKREEASVTSEEPKEETSMISQLTAQPKEETSVISEEPKEGASVISEQLQEETNMISQQSKEDPAPVEKQGEFAEEAKVYVASSASAPTTPGKDALADEEIEAKQVSASEPVTPLQEAVSKDKAVIETLPSASAPASPSSAVEKAAGTSRQATIPEELSNNLAFKGSKVKTAMAKRSDDEQPKKKEVARSNDVIEETKSRLLEKRKSKVKALVGAFETVMDSPHS